MDLNDSEKAELRKMLEKELKKVPEGKKIPLDKELLESLIFDTNIETLSNAWGENSGKQVIVKYIVWSGPFLSKINLEEVSFDDVLWNVDYENDKYFEDSFYHYNAITRIDLSGTNAKIDFSKSIFAKYNVDSNNFFIIKFSHFNGVDLSNNTIDCNCFISQCDFSNTNININLNSNYDIQIAKTNLSGNDFSKYTVDEKNFTYDKNIHLIDCDLTNTGLNIEFKLKSKNYKSEIVNEEIKKGYLNGCYVNGKKILSEEEQKALTQTKLEEFEAYKKEIFDSVSASIRKLNKTKKIDT